MSIAHPWRRSSDRSSTCRPRRPPPARRPTAGWLATRPGKLGLGDALIAAVAEDLGAVVVTRNRPDFERQGIEVLTYG